MSSDPGDLRWGILGAARIAASSFLPGLREAGGGQAALVASRDLDRAEAFANSEGVERAVKGYDALIDSPEIDAVYVAIPNSHHARWTKKALEAGKAVLCEKPLCVSPAETAEVLDTASATGSLLWESFAFPFQAQHRRLLELVASGAIGEVRELVSPFHFNLTRSLDIRLSAELAGGALADLGCYPVRLAQEVLSTRDLSLDDVVGFATGNGEVDTETLAIVDYGAQRLVLGCSFTRAFDVFTRLLGTEGQIHLSNPFHPRPHDALMLYRDGGESVEHPTVDTRSFSAALRHIHAVLRDEEAPAHLAQESALRSARTLAVISAACAPAHRS
ncbi:MAG: Gfo/Idh/MocA family oxidoreductase [Acidimicrobiales bacterium]|jgi:predicted dehydrogenase